MNEVQKISFARAEQVCEGEKSILAVAFGKARNFQRYTFLYSDIGIEFRILSPGFTFYNTYSERKKAFRALLPWIGK